MKKGKQMIKTKETKRTTGVAAAVVVATLATVSIWLGGDVVDVADAVVGPCAFVGTTTTTAAVRRRFAFEAKTRPSSNCFANVMAGGERMTTVVLMGSNDDVGDSSSSSPVTRRKRRVRKRRKVEVVEDVSKEDEEDGSSSSIIEEQQVPELRPRPESSVSMKVQDVRDLVRGDGAPASSSGDPASSAASNNASTSLSTQSGSPSTASTTTGVGGGLDDSLQQLLADAKEMQQVEDKKRSLSSADESEGPGETSGFFSMPSKKDGAEVRRGDDDEEFSIPRTIRNVASAIITADFFLVCGFLVWFLAGIFCSTVLKDDGVQIAFNNNFELLVQPALGVLMIGSIAGYFFKEDEGEEERQ